MVKLSRIQASESSVNRLQDQIIPAVNGLLGAPLAGGSLLRSVPLVAGDNIINHGLDRPLIGWFITRMRTAAVVHDLQDSNRTPNKTLALAASAAVVVDLLVF